VAAVWLEVRLEIRPETKGQQRRLEMRPDAKGHRQRLEVADGWQRLEVWPDTKGRQRWCASLFYLHRL
jgi:hypothetical protein